jgi:hypothetical protein
MKDEPIKALNNVGRNVSPRKRMRILSKVFNLLHGSTGNLQHYD